ncbi:tautomerase family protein [Pseudomonas aegrilactucae]|uniref:Tautomerase family protein n=1 Tax=Pseudomonas aegrilactucae TaxID=2854028 RepID=A0A9Q3AFU4_9PSED|nr:tautomerase family protein [Pseudomonas aegrilactucae]MBV6289759.1 tautomerase family protein [Pseudomonas aegrilactucae]
MPILNLNLSQAVDDTLKQQIAQQLTALTSNLLGKNAALTVVRINDVKSQWFVGGARVGQGVVFHLEITITQNTNTFEQIDSWIYSSYALLKDILGGVQGAPNYIAVKCMDGQFWGFDGLTQYVRSGR